MDLFMIDTRIGGRVEQAADPAAELVVDFLDGDEHQLLGAAQETWLFDRLQQS